MSKLIIRKDEVKVTRENIKQILAAQEEKDHELVEGEFISHEASKHCFDFRFKKWKRDDYVQYSLEHRKRYSLPRMVVHHINHNIHHSTYKELPNERGVRAGLPASNDGVFRGQENLKLKIIIPRCEFRPTVYDPEDTYINQPKVVDVTMHM